MAVTRRDIVRTAVSGIALAAVGLVVHSLQKFSLARYPAVGRPYGELEGLLRPPGALPESEFLAACIRCYRCQDACVPGAIQFYSEKDGELLHTPYVDPAKKGCTLCALCQPECPTGALVPIVRRENADMGSVELREDLCLSYKAKEIRRKQELLVQSGRSAVDVEATSERRGPCGECFMFCPLRTKAIKLQPGGFLTPLVFAEHCVGCGMCEEICRTVVRGAPAIRVVRTRRRQGSEVRT